MNRSEILEKLAAGEITVDEATRLLREANEQIPHEDSAGDAHEARPETKASPTSRPRWLKIRVSSGQAEQEVTKVSVNIPFSLVNLGLRVGGRFAKNSIPHEWEEVVEAIRRGEVSTLVEIENEEKGERVHIFVE